MTWKRNGFSGWRASKSEQKFWQMIKPGSELELHTEIVRYINNNYPNIRFYHAPNEGKRTWFQQFAIKYMGLKAGFPDLIIFNTLQHDALKRGLSTKYKGMAIELKAKGERRDTKGNVRQYTGKMSVAQKEWLEYLEMDGFYACVVHSIDEFTEALKYYSNT